MTALKTETVRAEDIRKGDRVEFLSWGFRRVEYVNKHHGRLMIIGAIGGYRIVNPGDLIERETDDSQMA